MIPERPPIVNMPMKAMAKQHAVRNRIAPPHSVESQLKILIPVGMAISIDMSEKAESAMGPMQTANMWWAHTPKPRKPISAVAYTIDGYPNSGFRANVG